MRYAVILLFALFFAENINAQKSKDLDVFKAIKATGKFELRLVESDKSLIKIHTDQIDLSQLHFAQKNGVLTIRPAKPFPKGMKVLVEVHYVDLDEINLSKGVVAYTRDTLFAHNLKMSSKNGAEMDFVISCDTLQTKVKRGAFMRLSGKADVVSLRVSPGGAYRATKLMTEVMEAKLNGGSAEVNVSNEITVRALNKGRFYFTKAPVKINKKASLGGVIGLLEDF